MTAHRSSARGPSLIRRLRELRAVTPEDATRLVQDLGIATLVDLELALDDGRVRQQLGAKVQEALATAASVIDDEMPRMPLGRALDYAETLIGILSRASASLVSPAPAGGLRRFEPLVREIVLVAAAPDPHAALDAVCEFRGFEDVPHRTSRRALLVYQGTEIDLRVAAPDDLGTVLFLATGSREHIKALTALRGRPKLGAREEDVFRQAGLPFVPPELRHGTGEVEAASRGTLPALVERGDIRGDLHMHSTYSDGRDPLDKMAAASSALGYSYIAITDHSQSAGASRTVTADQLARQRDEIALVQERFPLMKILHGTEVDILPDGSLDFPDTVLERLDLVLASLHDAARQDARTLTRRCIQAIRHPLVNVITHPANQLVGARPGYALDFDAVYAAAAETGTALEIDGAPSHLDLDGEHARAAAAAGVTLSIDSDCHRARALGRQMEMGVGTARRGWVERRHVLNTRPVDEVRAFVAAKRR